MLATVKGGLPPPLLLLASAVTAGQGTAGDLFQDPVALSTSLVAKHTLAYDEEYAEIASEPSHKTSSLWLKADDKAPMKPLPHATGDMGVMKSETERDDTAVLSCPVGTSYIAATKSYY